VVELATRLGPITLRNPLIAASGTVGSVVEIAGVADLRAYGAAVAKSISLEPWSGRTAPRVAPAGVGMLNGIGIQNPGIDRWRTDYAPLLANLPVPIWGSAVGRTVEDFVRVAAGLAVGGVQAIEINLSCPNLDGHLIALDPLLSAKVTEAVKSAVDLPVGAKLSPNSEDIATVALACADAGADWVVLTNTIWGAGIDIETRRPLLSGVIGGYSGPPLKPIALRCVIEVHRARPELPIVGCGGVVSGSDVVEYLLAGASAVGLGTVHFAEPRAARRILRELRRHCQRLKVARIEELVGASDLR
jgi:dihydroorotate dehydrogenase (NAD+) catalytic subunit